MQKIPENSKNYHSSQYLVMMSSKNEWVLDFEFLTNRFNFLVKLQDQIIYIYETIPFELLCRVHGFKNQENTKKYKNPILL